MSASIWGVAGAAIAGLLALIIEWIKTSAAQKTGGQLALAQVATATANAQVAIAQAEASAPTTRLAVIDQLKQGTF